VRGGGGGSEEAGRNAHSIAGGASSSYSDAGSRGGASSKKGALKALFGGQKGEDDGAGVGPLLVQKRVSAGGPAERVRRAL